MKPVAFRLFVSLLFNVLLSNTLLISSAAISHSAEMKVGQKAPQFTVKNQKGEPFSLSTRAGHWTVLYFYPKSETPGCTKQACAFRDGIDKIRARNAEVFGISINSVSEQAGFQKKHKLSFDLLADENKEVTMLYDAKMPVVSMAKRWTFIIDPKLVIRAIDRDVDPVKDASNVALKLAELQNQTLTDP